MPVAQVYTLQSFPPPYICIFIVHPREGEMMAIAYMRRESSSRRIYSIHCTSDTGRVCTRSRQDGKTRHDCRMKHH